MTSQDPYMPEGRDQSVHAQTPQRTSKWFNSSQQKALEDSAARVIDADPSLWYGTEKLIKTYPTLSRDTLVAIVMSGMGSQIPSELLEEMVQMDQRAQEAASDNWLFAAGKAASRRSIVVMEDLYNSSPMMVGWRTAINVRQGMSLADAHDKSVATNWANEARIKKLGFDVSYGTGWLPSDELVPDREGFWLRVKESILDGEYDGSPMQQVVQAEQSAMIQQLQETGMNPWALTRDQWLSTRVHRTTHYGNVYEAPFSPGAALAIGFTKPGTVPYNLFSGLIDATLRVSMEPTDFLFLQAGDLMMSTKVGDDFMTAYRKGGAAMSEALSEFGIRVVNQPIPIRTGRYKADGTEIMGEAMARTRTEKISPEGVAPIDISAEAIDRGWGRFQNIEEWDPTNAYHKPYIERGMTPNDVRAELATKGGDQGFLYYTIEHELVHAEVQQDWYHLIDSGDGTFEIDHALPKGDAPAELREVAEQMRDQGLTIEQVMTHQKLVDQADEAVETARKHLDGLKGKASQKMSPEARSAINGQVTDAGRDLARKKVEAGKLAAEHNTMVDQRRALDALAESYTEAHAVDTALSNMLDGSWSAPGIIAKYKRKAGLSNLLRPFVQPKSFTEWVQTGMGQRTLRILARTDDIEEIRKKAPYLDRAGLYEELNLLALTDDPAEVAKILQDAFNGNKIAGMQTPTIGRFYDMRTRGMDRWVASANFIGGPVAAASRRMGTWTRRATVGVGNHILSQTDMTQTLDTINAVLRTVGVDRDSINSIQRQAIRYGDTRTGIDEIAERLEHVIKQKLKDDDFYSPEEIDTIWKEWKGYEIQNRHYWVSNAGKDRPWLWVNSKFQDAEKLARGDIQPEAFMEAQFATTHRVMPDIRRLRRLHSHQRNAYERSKRWMQNRALSGKTGTWEPLGYDSTLAMKAGDATFGVWRDLALMRGGWAMRILPEEQLRFGASGYSGLFKDPIDYFISLTNRMDFTIPGDDITLADLIKMQESLGSADLRDLRFPPHMVQGTSWTIASQANNPEQFWAAITREYLLNASDRVVSTVALMGRDQAALFFQSKEGRKVIKEIAADASQEGSLGKIANETDFNKMMDVVELRLAQISGGDGIWLNPDTMQWLDLYDNRVYKATDTERFNNIQTLHDEVVRLNGGDDTILVGHRAGSRADAEALLNEVRGYDLDELEQTQRAAHVTREGNSELINLVGSKQLDDITITPDMTLQEVKAARKKVEKAYESRGVEAPAQWPISTAEMDHAKPGALSAAKAAPDLFFKWFNGVPSKLLNRQPFFQQAYGAKLAEAYYFGDSALRASLDEFMEVNPSFKVTFDLGKRKIFKDMGTSKFPKAFDPIDMPGVPKATPEELYEEAMKAGKYDRIPLAGDPEGFVTEALVDALKQIGIVENSPQGARGIYATTWRQSKEYSNYPNIALSGSNRVPIEDFLLEFEGRGLDTVLHQGAVPNAVYLALDDLLRPENLHIPLTRESILEAGRRAGLTSRKDFDALRSGEAVTYLLPGEGAGAGDEFVEAFEAARVLARKVSGMEVAEESVRRSAELLGWKGSHRTGGLTTSLQRTEGYSTGYVDIHRTDLFPEELQRHLAEEGDIEQLYTLEKRFRELAEAEGFVEAYTKVRADTRFRYQIPALKAKFAGNEDVEGIFHLVDQIVDGMPTPQAADSGRASHSVDLSTLDFIYTRLSEAFEGPLGVELQEQFARGLMAMYEGADRRAVTIKKMANAFGSGWAGNRKLQGQIVDYIADLVAPNHLSNAEFVGADTARKLVENEMGRALTDAEASDFYRLYERRSYRPDENIVAQSPLEPAARLPIHLAQVLDEHGLMVTANHQVGDMAQVFEQNLERAAVMRELNTDPMAFGDNLNDFTPFDDAIEGEHAATEASAALRSHIWAEQFTDKNHQIIKATRSALDKMPSRMKQMMGHVDYYTGEWIPSQAFELFNSSEIFRSYVYALKDRYKILSRRVEAFDQSLTQYIVKEPRLPDQKVRLDVPEEFWDEDVTQLIEDVTRADWQVELAEEGEKWGGGAYPYHREDGYAEPPRFFEDELAQAQEATRIEPMGLGFTLDHRGRFLDDMIEAYEDAYEWISLHARYSGDRGDGFSFGHLKPTDETLERGTIKLDLDGISPEERNRVAEKWFGPTDRQQYAYMETGGPEVMANTPIDRIDELEELMKAAKYDAIDETKRIFYDLSDKANVADAYKFIYPFGDAWYEVLTRWAMMMNPRKAGAQAFRNVRRPQQALNAGRQSGFLSTNEYGDEVFNWSFAPGMLSNSFIPNGSNVHLQGKMPISSLMFIDPTARGVAMPGIAPMVQVAARFAAPRTEGIPLFHDTMQWVTYGNKEEYRPGTIDELSDVPKSFMPTVLNRMVAALFDEQQRESVGNTKFQLFEALGMSGDPKFYMGDQESAAHAWDVADTAGTWLAWLRILDSWMLPGQPQYSQEFAQPDDMGAAVQEPQMTLDEILEETALLDPDQQTPIIGVLRLAAEYRHSRELFGDAEAALYMIERHDVLPSLLQSSSVGLVQRPVSWGGVEHLNANEWLLEHAPYTLVGTVPANADDRFASEAWNNLFGEILEVEGIDNQPIRRRRSPSEVAQAVQRGMGYDQMHHQEHLYENRLAKLRAAFDEDYASDPEYRAKKRTLDQIHRQNIEAIYAEFPIVRGSNQGNVIGSVNGVKVRALIDETITIGTPGSPAHKAFTENLPTLAPVAEQYAAWFNDLYRISRLQEMGTASGEWWMNGQSDMAEALRAALANQVQTYYKGIEDPDAQSYAKWLNENLLDPSMDDWEWIERYFAPQLQSYPSVTYTDMIPIGAAP
ncbi:MAG: hypothetical protein ABFR89_02545 [Actinomycetota bacterium]